MFSCDETLAVISDFGKCKAELSIRVAQRRGHEKVLVFGKQGTVNAVELLYALYSSRNIIRMIKSKRLRWAGHGARMGERRGAYRALVGKPEGRRPLGRPRRRWENNIKMDHGEVGWRHGLDRFGLEKGQVAGCFEGGNERSISVKCGEFLD
jgi:hypothetical protein